MAVRGDLQFSVTNIDSRVMGSGGKRLSSRASDSRRTGCLDPGAETDAAAVPAAIVVITSPDGAALHDIVKVARGRSPASKLL